MTESDDFPGEEQNMAALSETLREDLADLNWTPAALMDRMRSLGDYRKPQTICVVSIEL
ncbi:hypothetical protein AB9V60_00130 [Pseudomonas syringae pv. atrofaciens]|uniref:hypothetical protein n=1 Tax=Pseudomonas syringae TaxID=317 RepID=UPI00351E8364